MVSNPEDSICQEVSCQLLDQTSPGGLPFAILFCARRLRVFCAFSASRLGLRGIPVVSTGASRGILREKGWAILSFAGSLTSRRFHRSGKGQKVANYFAAGTTPPEMKLDPTTYIRAAPRVSALI